MPRIKVDETMANAISADIEEMDRQRPKPVKTVKVCTICNGSGLIDPFTPCEACNRTGRV